MQKLLTSRPTYATAGAFRGAPVSVSDVRAAHKKLNLESVHLTVNSGEGN